MPVPKAVLIPVAAVKCGSCPFRKGSEYQFLVGDLAASALQEGSRICHSTGANGLRGRTGKPERLCRGARDLQLQVFAASGFITTATDEAWEAKCKEMGIK